MVRHLLKGEFALNRFRLKYTIGEEVKYISHLDLLRTWSRAIKRGKIPIGYTKGFNPHPLISFGLPLSVGVTSESEYMDIELEEYMDPLKLQTKLNQVLPAGIKVLKVEKLDEYAKKIASIIYFADYNIHIYFEQSISEQFPKQIEHPLLREELNVEKKGKKGIKTINIRPLIYNIKIKELNKKYILLNMRLSAGSEEHLKPELVLQLLENHIPGFKPELVKIHRLALLDENQKDIM